MDPALTESLRLTCWVVVVFVVAVLIEGRNND